MTNREIFQNMETKDFTEKLREIFRNPFSEYIDYEKYFDGEDPDINRYIKCEYEGILLPSEAELITANAENGITGIDGPLDKDKYIEEHSRKVLVLESAEYYYGVKYATIADTQYNRILKVPVTSLKKN